MAAKRAAVLGMLTAAVMVLACSSGEPAPTPPSPLAPDLTYLQTADVPEPDALGKGWEENNDPEDDHGVEGSGAWLEERDPAEITAALPPIGCRGLVATPRYPEPAEALQGRYVDADGHAAVVVVLHYESDELALSFMRQYAQDISDCPAVDDGLYTRAITTEQADDERIVDRWTEMGSGSSGSLWNEVIVRSGSRVAIADVESERSSPYDLEPLATLLPRLLSR